MGKGILPRDESNVPAAGAVAYDDLDRVYPLQIDPATGRLLVTAIITSGGAGGAGTEYTDGDADATPTGTAIMGFDGTNMRAVTTDAQGDLQVDVLSLPTVTVQATDLDIRVLSSATDSIAVTGTVAVSEDTYSAIAADATATGDNPIVAVSGGNTLRLYYICLSANGANAADVTAIVKLGTTELFKVSLKAGAIWARNIGAGRHYLAGAAADDLIVELSDTQTVHVSAEYEII